MTVRCAKEKSYKMFVSHTSASFDVCSTDWSLSFFFHVNPHWNTVTVQVAGQPDENVVHSTYCHTDYLNDEGKAVQGPADQAIQVEPRQRRVNAHVKVG